MTMIAEMLAKRSSLTVDVYRILGDGRIGVTRILKASVQLTDEQLHINGLPSLKLKEIQMEMHSLQFISIRTREIPNVDKIVIF